MNINVTKAYLPPFEEYTNYLRGIWERGWLTNNGPLVQQLEAQLSAFLHGVPVQFTSNGTIAIQIAIKALKLSGEIVTTPFSYVATTTSIIWENCSPVFVDIESQTFCINAQKIEEAITEQTSAILATHVYGYPCDVEAIEQIAQKHNLKVIYDGAHAFGTEVHGRQLLTYGDLATCSFHATKLFHTIEGGCIVVNDSSLANDIWLLKSFGHIGDDYFSLGVNGKNSEFHAAMGLCNFPRVNSFIASRKKLAELYHSELVGLPIIYPMPQAKSLVYNYAYFPIIFQSETQMLKVKEALAAHSIYTRRYFFPSLNRLPYVKGQICPVSEDIASRVLCLPFYQELSEDIVRWIANVVRINFVVA
ncbi:DegT/DnrJ/EryC1/StrS family aminotransferase [Hymenobacter psoromatis]|uniref:DegT/DnrJ/EryC1/StrS family aminotransferase n=1 Tax=Hymenobacter psoromatis TaxID=1484116 RepID=UPI001CBB7DC8|nr:DegT/DnrJ/EryC1/StrS family aminotransferase [Hymenobacter psoromatis]